MKSLNTSSRSASSSQMKQFSPKGLLVAMWRHGQSREDALRDFFDQCMVRLKEEDINFKIITREKELFSVYEKMKSRRLPLDQIIDVYGLRIIVDEPKECYHQEQSCLLATRH